MEEVEIEGALLLRHLLPGGALCSDGDKKQLQCSRPKKLDYTFCCAGKSKMILSFVLMKGLFPELKQPTDHTKEVVL